MEDQGGRRPEDGNHDPSPSVPRLYVDLCPRLSPLTPLLPVLSLLAPVLPPVSKLRHGNPLYTTPPKVERYPQCPQPVQEIGAERTPLFPGPPNRHLTHRSVPNRTHRRFTSFVGLPNKTQWVLPTEDPDPFPTGIRQQKRKEGGKEGGVKGERWTSQEDSTPNPSRS